MTTTHAKAAMWRSLCLILAVFLCDVFTKQVIMLFLQRQGWPVDVTAFFQLVVVWNDGISFGLLQLPHDFMPYALSGMAFAVSVILWLWLRREVIVPVRAALALIIGGAVANGVDRLRFGAVFDFIHLHYKGWSYPAFNVADSCIVIGVCVLLYDQLFAAQRRTASQERSV